jgi:glycosyltransferase involved in cell wall biosynthesis
VRFSLIVTTLGRYDDLIVLFRSLTAQTFQDFEVLLIDQNPDDKLAPIVAEFGECCHIRHLHTRKKGLCLGRNTGIDHSTGDIVTLADDDCELAPDFLARVDELFRARPEIDGITTNTHARQRQVDLGVWNADSMHLDKLSVMDRCAEFTTYLRRSAIGQERYDEQWGLGSGTPWGADEGPDFLIRLMQNGARIFFFPNLVVYHPEKSRAITKAILDRTFYYGRGRGHFYRLHRFPPKLVGVSLVRSLGGVVISAAKLDRARAAYYGLSFAGKVRGLFDSQRGVAPTTGEGS